MENTQLPQTQPAPKAEKAKVVYPSHWRRTFAVPLRTDEKDFLAEAAALDGIALATWIRNAALAMAATQLGKTLPEVE